MPRLPDVVVVGAGIVGSAVAYELARRGASVELVEGRRVGMGATYASAGMLAPHIEAGTPGPLQELTLRSLALFDEFVARVEADSGLSVSYRRTGTLQTALDDEAMRELRQTASDLGARGVSATILDATSVRAEEPQLTPAVLGGLFVSSHGFVAAAELAHALTAAARRHGAQIVEGSRVRRITPANAELVVETDRGSLTGGAVVLAAGSWSGHIEIAGAESRPPVRPVRGQLLRLAWKEPLLRRVTWGAGCYAVPWDDGTLLVGATVEDVGFDEQTTVGGVGELLQAACSLFPAAAKAGFIDARAGLRPASPDLLPIIGPSTVNSNLMYATAHYRNGVLLAPVTAVLVADAILDERMDPILATFGPGRFGAI